MNIFNGMKHTLLIITFVFLLPSHSYAASGMQLAQQDASVQQAVTAFTQLIFGPVMVAAGLLTLADIPLTSLQEISLSMRNQLSKENLRKLHIGRSIWGYSAITAGTLTTLV